MTEINRPWITTWGELLSSVQSLRRSDMVSFGEGPTSKQDRCLVSDSMDLDDADDIPPEAARQGWNTALLKEEIEGVIDNLRQQVGDPSSDLILLGVEHYVKHDAFLVLT